MTEGYVKISALKYSYIEKPKRWRDKEIEKCG
jgi:hypothetical protein